MLNTKKIIALFTIILITFIGILLFEYYKLNKIEEDVELRKKVVNVVKKSKQINFQEITDFDWDTLYIFTPYSQPVDVFKVDKITNYNTSFSIEYIDNINMIGFVHKNKLIKFIEINRSDFEFERLNYHKVTKDDATFKAISKDGGLLLKQ